MLGAEEGFKLGIDDGILDEISLGASLGILLGAEEGFKLGIDDGILDGVLLGVTGISSQHTSWSVAEASPTTHPGRDDTPLTRPLHASSELSDFVV